MQGNSLWKILAVGLLGGFVGNGVLGALFSSRPMHAILYDPRWQSTLFIEITPHRNVAVSVVGLVVLSVAHAWFFSILMPSIPGKTWLAKGAFWGFTIWALYWVFQEWFIYNTLLGEPLLLNVVELTVLLLGCLAEGMVIAFLLSPRTSTAAGRSGGAYEIPESPAVRADSSVIARSLSGREN